jgi:hypothetical protein
VGLHILSWVTLYFYRLDISKRFYIFRESNQIITYKVVQIWPGQTVTCLHTNRPGHIWTTLYNRSWQVFLRHHSIHNYPAKYLFQSVLSVQRYNSEGFATLTDIYLYSFRKSRWQKTRIYDIQNIPSIDSTYQEISYTKRPRRPNNTE